MSPQPNSYRSVENGWRRVFERFQLDPAADLIELTSRQLNEVRDEGHAPDARLMVKFDSREKLPTFLRERGFFIVPVLNGRYALVKGDGYCDLPASHEPTPYSTTFSPVELGTRSRSENSRLNFALNSGLLEHHFEVAGLRQTFSGKRRSPRFEFSYRDTGPITVDGVQIEIDGGYQSSSDALILEAKMGTPASFHVRQLYFPVRALTTDQPGVNVRAAFVGCDRAANIFHFWDIAFPSLLRYDSARVIRMRTYEVEVSPAGPESEVVGNAARVVEPTAELLDLVSQANNLDLVARIPFIIREGRTLGRQIAESIGYVGRQGNYYREAAVAMGLIRERSDRTFELTELGNRFTQVTSTVRTELLLSLVLQTRIVRRVLEQLGPNGLDRSGIAEIIRMNSALSGSTLGRRADCLLSWLRWVGERTGLFEVRERRLFRR